MLTIISPISINQVNFIVIYEKDPVIHTQKTSA